MPDFSDLVAQAIKPSMNRAEREAVYGVVRQAVLRLRQREDMSPDDPRLAIQQHLVEETIRDVEADIALYHLISGSPYQHYQHVGNLREYAPGRSLAFDWAERLLAKYSRYYDRPVRTLSPDGLGRAVAERTSFRQAGVSGVLDTAARTVSVSAAGGGTLFLTAGPNAAVTKTALRRGETRVYRLR